MWEYKSNNNNNDNKSHKSNKKAKVKLEIMAKDKIYKLQSMKKGN